MGLRDQLRRVAGKLGLISVVDLPTAKRPTKVPTRQVYLKDMVTEIREQEVQALAQLPAELSVSFDKVFSTAGVITPSHGWTIDRLKDVLSTPQYKDMDRPAAQKALLGLLAAEKATVEDLVKDAMARDHAIDAFAQFVQQKMDTRILARQHQITDLETQIHDLQERCQRLNEETKADKVRWHQWQETKQTYEKQMAWALGYLLDRQIVSVDPIDSDA